MNLKFISVVFFALLMCFGNLALVKAEDSNPPVTPNAQNTPTTPQCGTPPSTTPTQPNN